MQRCLLEIGIVLNKNKILFFEKLKKKTLIWNMIDALIE